MFSTFTKFSANNIDRINRSKDEGNNSGSELDFDKLLEKTSKSLGAISEISKLQKEYGQQDKKKDSLLSKVLGGDTNQMIFGAMVFAFLVIATMGVAATAGPLAVAAMGVLAAGVGGALVAKAVKKFRNASKSQGSIGSQTSSTLKQLGNQLQKSLNNDLGIADKEEKGPDLSSLLSSISGRSKSSPEIDKTQNEVLKKELTADILKLLNMDIIRKNEEKLNQEITDLQGKFYGNLKKVMGDDKFCDSASPNAHIPEETVVVLKKLLDKGGFKGDDSTISEEAKALKDIMKDYDRKGLKEQKLVLKTLNNIFDKCDDSFGTVPEQQEATNKKDALANIINKDSKKDSSISVDSTKEDEVKDLIKAQKEKFDKDSVSKNQKDTKHKKQKTDLGM